MFNVIVNEDRTTIRIEQGTLLELADFAPDERIYCSTDSMEVVERVAKELREACREFEMGEEDCLRMRAEAGR